MRQAMVTVNTGASATAMAEEIFGDTVTIVSADYTGSGFSSGIYTGADTSETGFAPSETGVILSTGRASRVHNPTGDPNRIPNTSTNSAGPNNDSDFNAVAGASTFDASFLEVDFVPTEDTYSIQFVYSSEEYPEFVGSQFNDIVAVWINGVAVDLAVGTGQSDIGNINPTSNSNLYLDNTGDTFNTEMDGFTVTLTLTLDVVPNMINSIKIGVADVGDSNYDTNLLIASDSIQAGLLAVDDTATIVTNGTPDLDVLANDISSSGATLTVTQINGIDVMIGDTVILNSGQSVTLNGDGTLGVVNTSSGDDFNFTYTVSDGNGQDDVAFVQVDTIPCFVAGTRIRTPDGERLVEELAPGDLVETMDSGSQPLKWVGRRRVAADGEFAPVR
ncbi:MAG: choice-of-anchor L domain-containing protein, partial [Pseudomonadota bacterium]